VSLTTSTDTKNQAVKNDSLVNRCEEISPLPVRSAFRRSKRRAQQNGHKRKALLAVRDNFQT